MAAYLAGVDYAKVVTRKCRGTGETARFECRAELVGDTVYIAVTGTVSSRFEICKWEGPLTPMAKRALEREFARGFESVWLYADEMPPEML